MVDGSCCTFCGQYFKHPERDEKNEPIGIYVHGYPVVCYWCWETLSDKSKHQKAVVPTY